jgi:hypothetical protein
MDVTTGLIRNRHYLAARKLDYVKPFIEVANHAKHAVAVAAEEGQPVAVIDLLCEAVVAAHKAQNQVIAAGIAIIAAARHEDGPRAVAS